MIPRRPFWPQLVPFALAAAALTALCAGFALVILFHEWKADCFRGCYSNQTTRGTP